MPINNLNNVHPTPAEVTKTNTAINDLEGALVNIDVHLTPDDRQRYGSINEQNKLFVNKVMDYYNAQPALADPDVDWAEFNRDFNSRAFCEATINKLQSLIDRLKNAKTLYDYDNNQSALQDYSHTAYQAGRGTAGYENKREELKQFFNRTRPNGGGNNTPGNTGNNPPNNNGGGTPPGGTGTTPTPAGQ